jgi:hypothetical protein
MNECLSRQKLLLRVTSWSRCYISKRMPAIPRSHFLQTSLLPSSIIITKHRHSPVLGGESRMTVPDERPIHVFPPIWILSTSRRGTCQGGRPRYCRQKGGAFGSYFRSLSVKHLLGSPLGNCDSIPTSSGPTWTSSSSLDLDRDLGDLNQRGKNVRMDSGIV